MDRVELDPEMGALLEAPSPAVLTLYRPDGSGLTAPVWFRANGDALEVVIAAGDRKLAYLGHDPRCTLLVFEATPPFRGVQVRAEAVLSTEGVAEARRSIASRYLGEDRGRRFAEQRGERGFVLRLPLGNARTWDLQAILPT